MGLTDKQNQILLKNGYEEAEIDAMSYEEASKIIGEILAPKNAQANQAPYRKVIRQPQTHFVEKPGFKTADKFNSFDKVSYYVSYAKDLCIAMLQAHTEARKIDNKIEPLAIADLMEAAVDAIQKARKGFE